ncbi:MBL fold metallo-hydrolase [Luteimonas sp. SX5]|uniref:MBL fold metallo-hydrolase n=1 Tax=Luteimonas galliterrae TaxID=2940486 RepID=A0ABT0MM44_9GAMM|nr:MBL fold metallo-hydrolase [Luteimonas galliterrae]MCL1635954.1 MBL fold metallo-hydrolase [Luteimonas galliterrae]
MTTLTLCACSTARYAQSPQYRDGGFRNPVAPRMRGNFFSMTWRFLFDKPDDTVPSAPLPVSPLSREQLLAAPDGTLYRLGHSTVLIKLGGAFWLTDPVFSLRASPVQWAGPKRFHPPPISIDALPPIKGVILSHDHYDHLDKAAILALADKTEHFLTPLGVGDLLIEWGVDERKVLQLDWWDSIPVGGLRFVATPSQHFSGRAPFADNPTLWTSWVIEGDGLRLFFSGDTGYFDGFKAIGDRYGPFDLTLIECGAYNTDWPDVHMQPEQTLQAHLDLRGRRLMPVHNGTFDLAFHGWREPLERISALAAARGARIVTPAIGQPLSIREPAATGAWWTAAR